VEENSPTRLQLLMLAPNQAISFDPDPYEVIKMNLDHDSIDSIDSMMVETDDN
jgi:hypothetical protein